MAEMKAEDLEALQQQCVFCHIVSGKVPARTVYEDDKVKAVLDINPANPGHILLLTKKHYFVMPQIPDDETSYLGMISKGLSHAVLKALKAEGTTIFIANGAAAGQRAQHFMLHIIPRMEGDNIGIDFQEQPLSSKDLEQVRKALQKGVNKVFKLKEEPESAEEEAPEEEVAEEAPKKPAKTKKKTKKKAAKKKTAKKAPKKEEKLGSLDEISKFLTRS